MKLTTIAAAALVLASTAARAEVSEITIAQQFGVSFLPLMIMERGGLIEKHAKAAGIDGCLLTDASVEEAAAYVDVMRSAGLDTVFLAAPTSTPRRLKLVAEFSTGFVYLVSRTGVTGTRDALSDTARPLVVANASRGRVPSGRSRSRPSSM